ncbi:MAG: efflux RND transporter periplasmic adaptor subunit, partial [Planctomycetota bacterium]
MMTDPKSPIRRLAATLGKGGGLLVIALVGVLVGIFLHATFGVGGDLAASSDQIWTCSMHPDVRLPEPGPCPKCGMPLILAEDATGGLREFSTSEAAIALMDIEVAPVERRFVEADVRMVGKIDYDETKLAYITSWVPGRLDRLFVDYTGVPVQVGDHMVYIYSPELLSAQAELIQALQAVQSLSDSDVGIVRDLTEATAAAAREKLRLLGLTAEQIDQIAQSGRTEDHLTIYSPVAGIVIHKNAQEGMYVDTGTRIYTIADLSQVWVKLDAYESDLMWLRYGQTIEFTTVSYPGEVFTGKISFIDPVLDSMTRTVKVRVNAPNAAGKLKPGMFVKAVVRTSVAGGGRVMDADLAGKWISPMHPEIVRDGPGACDVCGMPLVRAETLGYVQPDPQDEDRPLVIPVSAALWTGTRAIVYVQVPDAETPTFEGREIVLGPRAGDYYLVRSGLAEGELVVVRGSFKIDSALQLQAKRTMMSPDGGPAGGGHDHGAPPETAEGTDAQGPGELPAGFTHQLHEIAALAEVVHQALAEEGLTQSRQAFAALGQAVDATDTILLTDHAQMLWTEYAMRLTNDAVEGAQAETMDRARRVGEVLKNNV